MAYVDQHTRSRLKPVAAVALVHLAIGYAFISGLATTVIDHVPAVFKLIPITETAPPPPNPEPLPPRVQPREHVTAPTQQVDLSRQPDIGQPYVPLLPPVTQDRVDVTPAPPSPPLLSQAVQARARGDRGGWITADDYPSRSLRGGEEGIVTIAARIEADGRVSGCTVTASSGFPLLDEATCRLYQRRARFVAARDEAGRATAATTTDRIRWTIPR